ncbi:uncharacterized protein LOC135950408 [Calliphora vicina]|uniref:uncharacterized protein LOC135950408 n=1 Tax=Calliphora vicina TaxID=7373 RepID=UPI00325B6884
MSTMQEYLNNSLNEQSKANMVEDKKPSSNIPYMLFMYRQDLRRFNKSSLKLSNSKLKLSQEMVSYSVDHITEYSLEELMNINIQIDFTRNLKSSMEEKKQMQKCRTIKNQMVDRKRG